MSMQNQFVVLHSNTEAKNTVVQSLHVTKNLEYVNFFTFDTLCCMANFMYALLKVSACC